MKYMLLIYGNEAALQGRPKAQADEMLAAYGAYTEALQKSGALASANRLQRSVAATTVRVVDGKTKVLDGPYAETKEQLLGFYVVDCKNLDEALDVARELGAANPGGAYEIRPVGVLNPGSVAT